ncbi:hypothetical protein K2173_023873 [Erythroxylum novogranatense]|uniref:Uncharacterized protein n=1 Tax=Erythroxylum novogranatense TaxID=1862640 RepID=A0AAV8TRS3_9ROSI|nr:hypothetical protein K2173_023873 [Erythroxylum novogranatense]
MAKIGCDAAGNLNQEKFSQPLPWIGIYVAAASLACGVAMFADFIHGFRRRKLWFPSKYFSINATSLTIMTVAVKFSVDLNTAMPDRVDQLSKLSSGVLICTIMSNSMPSLGTMDNKDIWMNLIALGILVITVVVNICIQLGTGVIYQYWKEHAFVMFLMLLLLLILGFSALIVPTSKKYLEFKYSKKYEMALKEGCGEASRKTNERLKEDLMKFWMMAHTCSPQFVIGRSVTCIAAGALSLLGTLTLAEAMLRSYLMSWSFRFCNGESDYKWSTTLVLITQTIAIGIGTIAPAIRWFTAVKFRCPKRRKKSMKDIFRVECYWKQYLVEMKECPFAIRIKSRHCRKVAHDAKMKFLDLCIGVQTAIVLASKVIQFISIFFMSRLLMFLHFCKKLKLKSKNSISIDSESEKVPSLKPDLSRFVLHLEGEDELVDLMMKNNFDTTDHWMNRAKKKQPKHLMQLLEKSTFPDGFKGVKEFDCEFVCSLGSENPPNCWALPVVTLAAIAVALPDSSKNKVKNLLNGVHEGLMHVRLIEDILDEKGDITNIRKAAYVVWLEVDLYQKWLDVDLDRLSVQAESTKEILEGLADAAKKRFEEEFKIGKQCQRETPSNWPIKVLAAHSMYRISQTILHSYECKNYQMSEKLFEALTTMISDILGACLTNLRRVILHKCLSSTIESREDSIRDAVYLLGKTDKILNLLNQMEFPRMCLDRMSSIDEWRSLHKMKDPLSFNSASAESESDSSSHLYVTIV